MSNSVSHGALPYPIKGARYTLQVPFLDADGDPTDPTTPDTEVSQDGGAFADAAEEVTTISGSNGLGYITLTGAETNNSTVGLAFKVASGPKATLIMLNPRVLASVGTGTLSAGSAGGGTLGTLLAYDVTGCFVKTTGGTGGGGTGGANNQVRKIVTYNTGTGAFTVAPNWETTPDATTTYDVLLPEGVTLGMLRALNPTTPGRTLVVDAAGLADATAVKLGPSGSGTALTARDVGASVLLSAGTSTGQLDFTSGVVKSNLAQILGTALTETAGQIAAAFKKFFNIGTPASTMDALTLVGTATNLTNAPTNGDLTATMKTSVTTAATAATPNLNAAYDAAKTASSQTSVDDLPTNAELATALGTADDAVLAQVALVKAKTDNLPETPAATSDIPTAAAVADAVWDEAQAGHTTPDTFGEYLDATVSGVSTGGVSAGDIADAVWDEARAGHTTSGTFGQGAASVQGNVTGSTGSIATGGITNASFAAGAIDATAIAADAIGASELAAGAASEIATAVRSELATELARVDVAVSTRGTGAALDAAGVRSAVGLASANLDTQLDALPTAAENATAAWAAGTRILTAGTNIVLAKGTGVTGFNDLSAAQVNAEADTAIVDAALATAANLALAKTAIDAINLKTTNLPSDPADQSLIIAATDSIIAAIADKTGYRLSATGVNDILRTALTEGYAAEGATVTLEQAIYMIVAILFNRDVAGTELTARKLDGTTAAMTFTLDDATDPTSQVRAT